MPDGTTKAEKAYQGRINAVIDYIEMHLDEDLSLRTLASVANFSPFYFHRIFRALVGETVNKFTQRIRIEKASTLLLIDKERSVTEVAYETGFSSPASLARLFREYYGMSASEWRDGGYEQSKICKTKSKNGKAKSNIGKDVAYEIRYSSYEQQHWRITMKSETASQHANVTVKELPPMKVAYVRHVGPYKGDGALFETLFGKLFGWAGPRGLLAGENGMALTVYHDNPEITDDRNLRISVCLVVDDEVEGEGDIGTMRLPGGTYAIGTFRLAVDEYQGAWDAICGAWLPQSGYVPDERPTFERMLNDPNSDPEGKHEVEICIPVKPL